MPDQSAEPNASQVKESVESPAKNGKPTIAVKVYAPFQVYYEGDAYSISAVNDVGPFDILPKHRNFLCMLVPCELKIDTPSYGQKLIKINRALMRVKADSVVVFVDV